MKTLPWRDIFAWLLAAFFVLGGSLNIFATAELVEDYRRWGYPGWFHYVTGSLEWMAAALIMLPVTRLAGSTLAAAIMVSAAGTVLMHGEYSHAIAPMIVLTLVGLNAFVTWRRPFS